jgi:hypothetical protein
MPATLKAAPKVAMLGLVACLIVTSGAQANPKSTFVDPLCGGPNCTCVYAFLCVVQQRINNPEVVHIKILSSGYDSMQVRQGSKQWTVKKSGDVIYVPRSSQGPTSISLPGGGGWMPVNLNEPTTVELKECETYANKAVEAAKDNVNFKCGYGGGRWAADYKAHYNACAFAPGSAPILAETKARTDDIATCKNKTASKAEPQAKDFNGSWTVTTSQGGAFKFLLTQQGTVVTGQMINGGEPKYSGTLTGTLKPDGQVGFRFSQPGIDTAGSGSFYFHPDANNFIGWVRTDGGSGATLEGKRQ